MESEENGKRKHVHDEGNTENCDVNENFASFKDGSTDCAICLGALDNGEEVITLQCGHLWHLQCIKEQLEQAKPNPAQRLVLTGCRCAKCGCVCDHPKLQHLTRQTDALREKVDAVLRDQIAEKEKDSDALEDARRKYAVYLCSHCNEPYFGGTIACADTAEGEVPPDERLCVACAPQKQHQARCLHPVEHRGHHIWKCRYCCKIATHICYGTVHFCNDCHDRNSERVELIRGQQSRQRRDNQPPWCLTPIACPGGDACPYPKQDGQTQHHNGKSARCEQVYACGWCQSKPTKTEHAFVEPPGSRNLLENGCGEDGPYRAWRQYNPHAHWQVEQSDTPLRDAVTTNFVSSFSWCVMGQSVPLSKFVHDPAQVRVEVSAKYMGRTDCASVFRLETILLNRSRRILQRQQTDTLSAPADFWERASLTLEPTAEAHEVVLLVHGKDVPFWAGNFGSKVTDCQVRVLGSPEELERHLTYPQDIDRGWPRRNSQASQGRWRRNLAEIVIPLLSLILFAWLLQ